AAAHRRGILHRDLKPSNLLLVGGDVASPKIGDFGIARHVGLSTSLTRTGSVLGTPQYMSPEQARGEREIDARTDVFALGCLLFHALAGRPPFTSTFTPAVLLQIVLDEAPRVGQLAPQVSEELEQVVARMLAKDARDRYADADAVAEALDALAPMSMRSGGPKSVATPALTSDERRISAFVLARTGADAPARGPAGTVVDDDEVARRLRELVKRWDVDLVRLEGGVAVALRGPGAGADQVVRAARCALAVRAALPGASIAVTFGESDTARVPLEHAIEAAVRMLADGVPGIRLDPRLAPVLASRFEIVADPRGALLVGPAQVAHAAHMLLGRPAPFVGRRSELRVLEELASGAFSESRAVAVLVVGEAGMGKSRLRDQLFARLAESDDAPALWFAQGDPMSVGAPLAMLGQIVRAEARVQGGEAPVVAEAKLRERVARSVDPKDVARVTAFLAALGQVAIASEPDVEVRAARNDPTLMGDQMRRAFEDFARAESARRPLCIVLEDLHWSDPATVGFVHALLRNAADRPLVVLALARPEVRELFPKLWAGRPVHELPLAPLSKRAAETLVAGALGDAGSNATVKAIVERAAGNPLYLEELVRAHASGRADVPATILLSVQARLDELDGRVRRVLRAASVFGGTFWRGGLVALLGGGSGRSGAQRAADVASWLTHLEGAEIVRRIEEARFPGEEAWSFGHALVRDVAYATLTADDKRLAHALAGSWLEAVGERDARVLGEHFERGGEGGRAATAYARAAEVALDANDPSAALALADRATACGASGEVVDALELVVVEAHHWRGDYEAAYAHAAAATSALARGSAGWIRAIGHEARAAFLIGARDKLGPLAQRLAEVPVTSTTAVSFTVAAVRVLVLLWYAGDAPSTEALAARVRGLAPSVIAEPVARAFLNRMAAYRALFDGDLAAHFEAANQSRAAFAEAGDVRVQALAAGDAGFAQVLLGRYAGAKELFEEALACAERVGLDEPLALALHNLAHVYSMQGDLDRALACAERAAEGYGRLADEGRKAVAGAYVARVRLLRGEREAALRDIEPHATNPRVTGERRARCLAVLADVLLAGGDVERAIAAASEAVALVESDAGVQYHEASIRLAHVRALAARDPARAREAALAARTRLLERAAKIGDAAARASFLTHVPENAETLALAARLG
ncbi:MAG TPA: AAA family ATPase, partial [Minicystis sp.]|nr:AAA family ATPase [Minicystis sp.]